ncbi:MAG: LysR substrate-binding domain-containing protein [bacterium]
MNLRDLHYFVTIAELKNFGRAADSCHVSQPTLSSQIKKMEEFLGVELFERSKKTTRLTQAGSALLPLAQKILLQEDEMRQLARHFADPFAGRLTVGLIPTIAPYLLPYFARSMRQSYPELQMIFQEDITDRLTENLLAGQIDCAIIATDIEQKEFTKIDLYAEPFYFIVPNAHKLARRKIVTISEINQEELLLLTKGHCLRDQSLQACKVENTEALGSVRATSLDTLINLVASEYGTTLIPKLAIYPNELTVKNLVALPIKESTACRDVALVYRKSSHRDDVFAALAQEIRSGAKLAL